jgi:hypothetical protein
MEREARAGGFLLGIELTGVRWENNRADFRADMLEASGAAQLKKPQDLQGGNIIPLEGSAPSSMEAASGERAVAQIRVPSAIPGVGRLLVKGEQWRLAPGLRTVWRTLGP